MMCTAWFDMANMLLVSHVAIYVEAFAKCYFPSLMCKFAFSENIVLKSVRLQLLAIFLNAMTSIANCR